MADKLTLVNTSLVTESLQAARPDYERFRQNTRDWMAHHMPLFSDRVNNYFQRTVAEGKIASAEAAMAGTYLGVHMVKSCVDGGTTALDEVVANHQLHLSDIILVEKDRDYSDQAAADIFEPDVHAALRSIRDPRSLHTCVFGLVVSLTDDPAQLQKLAPQTADSPI